MATGPTQIGIRAKPVAFSQQGTAVKLVDLKSWRDGQHANAFIPSGPVFQPNDETLRLPNAWGREIIQQDGPGLIPARAVSCLTGTPALLVPACPSTPPSCSTILHSRLRNRDTGIRVFRTSRR